MERKNLKPETNSPYLPSVGNSCKGTGGCWYQFSLWANGVRVAPQAGWKLNKKSGIEKVGEWRAQK